MISSCRLTLGSVDSMTSESGVVENVGVATRISLISQFSPDTYNAYCGSQVTILISGCQPTLDSVDTMTSESGVIENMV